MNEPIRINVQKGRFIDLWMMSVKKREIILCTQV